MTVYCRDGNKEQNPFSSLDVFCFLLLLNDSCLSPRGPRTSCWCNRITSAQRPVHTSINRTQSHIRLHANSEINRHFQLLSLAVTTHAVRGRGVRTTSLYCCAWQKLGVKEKWACHLLWQCQPVTTHDKILTSDLDVSYITIHVNQVVVTLFKNPLILKSYNMETFYTRQPFHCSISLLKHCYNQL